MRAGTALLKVNTLTRRLGETRNRTAPELKRSRCVSVTRLKLDMFRGCEYSGRALITLKKDALFSRNSRQRQSKGGLGDFVILEEQRLVGGSRRLNDKASILVSVLTLSPPLSTREPRHSFS